MLTKKWPRGQLQRVSLIWAEETQLLRRERLSTQACPQSVWEKARLE